MMNEIIGDRRTDNQPTEVMLYELLGVVGFGVFLASAILQILPQFAPLLTIIGGTVTVLAGIKGIHDGGNR